MTPTELEGKVYYRYVIQHAKVKDEYIGLNVEFWTDYAGNVLPSGGFGLVRFDDFGSLILYNSDSLVARANAFTYEGYAPATLKPQVTWRQSRTTKQQQLAFRVARPVKQKEGGNNVLYTDQYCPDCKYFYFDAITGELLERP